MLFSTPTLLVVILLISAASLASYLLSQWVPLRSSGRTLAWASLSAGTVLLLAAAAVVALSMHSLSTIQLPFDVGLPEHMIKPAPPDITKPIDNGAAAALREATREKIRRQLWDAAINDLLEMRGSENATAQEKYDVLDLLLLVQQKKQDYVAAAVALDAMLKSPLMPQSDRPDKLGLAVYLNYRTQFYADSIRYGREYLEHYSDADGAVRRMVQQATSAYAALDPPPQIEPQRYYSPEASQ
jgi:hypothetical protein